MVALGAIIGFYAFCYGIVWTIAGLWDWHKNKDEYRANDAHLLARRREQRAVRIAKLEKANRIGKADLRLGAKNAHARQPSSKREA